MNSEQHFDREEEDLGKDEPRSKTASSSSNSVVANGPLDWAARVALATVLLYAAIIAFEVGYFWRLGGAMMAVFTPTEHAVHAVGKMGILIALTVAGLAALIYPNLVLDLYKTQKPVPSRAKLKPTKTPTRRVILRIVGFASLVFSAFAMIVWDLYITDGFSPPVVFLSALGLFIIAYNVESGLGQNRHSYRVPAVVLGTLFLPTAGWGAFNNATDPKKATLIQVCFQGQETDGALVFGSSDKILYAVGQQLFLQDLEGKWRREIKFSGMRQPVKSAPSPPSGEAGKKVSQAPRDVAGDRDRTSVR